MAFRIWSSVLDQFGVPATLREHLDAEGEALLKVTPASSSPSVSSASVTSWQDWGMMSGSHGVGNVQGWSSQSRRRETVAIPELNNLSQTVTLDSWSCDLRELFGLASSKSDLRKFHDLDDMVRQNAPEMIKDISEAGLHANLSHQEIRIIHGRGDYFEQFAWAGFRTYLSNSGGSHHLAAARYICGRIGAQVTLHGELHRHVLVPEQVRSLREKYDIYLVSSAVLSPEFGDALEAMRASYFWTPLPRGEWQEYFALFLPKSETRSAVVSKELKTRGFFDLGAYWSDVSSVT